MCKILWCRFRFGGPIDFCAEIIGDLISRREVVRDNSIAWGDQFCFCVIDGILSAAQIVPMTFLWPLVQGRMKTFLALVYPLTLRGGSVISAWISVEALKSDPRPHLLKFSGPDC